MVPYSVDTVCLLLVCKHSDWYTARCIMGLGETEIDAEEKMSDIRECLKRQKQSVQEAKKAGGGVEDIIRHTARTTRVVIGNIKGFIKNSLSGLDAAVRKLEKEKNPYPARKTLLDMKEVAEDMRDELKELAFNLGNLAGDIPDKVDEQREPIQEAADINSVK